ncbi:hypothetical protein CRG98_048737, partial [Punica granatum]
MHVRGARCTGGRLACAGARARESRGCVRGWTRGRAAVRAGARLCARACCCARGRAAVRRVCAAGRA